MVWERYGSEGLVTMAEAFAKAKASKAVMTTLESALVASWKVDKMSAFDVFELLKLDQDIDYSLYVKMLRMWVNYVKRSSKSPDLTMKLVIASFNDVKTRAMVLSGLIKIDGADEVVMSVQNSLSKYLKLHESKISASDGFTALRLDKAGANLFNDPNYKIWLEFVVNKTGTLPDLVAKTVSKHYSDEDLLTMVEAFAKAETSDAVMTTLESALVVSWKDKKMSTFGVFKLLKLDQKVDDLLRDKLFSESKFAIWFQYAAKGGTLPKSATKIMLKHYSDDDLLTMFEAFAVKGKARDVVMTTLESALVVSCKDKKSFAFDVFKLLKLDQKVDDLLYDKLFSESKFAIWFQYAAKGGTLPESAAKIMLEHYSDEDLLTMVEAFANAKARDVVMTTLESALVVCKDKKSFAFDVFKLLKLDQKVDDLLYDKLFSESKFAIWFQYAAKGGTLPESAAKIMLEHYSDDDLLTMFEAFANAKARDVVMTTLESALVVSWKDKKMSTFGVFTQLKLDQKVDDLLRDKLFSESKFAIWFQYAAEGGTLPKSATMIMLKHYSDDDLLTMFEAFAVKGKARDVVMTTLESVLVVSWKDKKMSTFDVFTQLKLDQKVDDLLRDKLFSESKFAIWFQYAAEGGTLPKSATMIMLKHYSDDDLLTMFEAFAVKGKARDVVMTTLESVLVVSWKDKKMSTFDVFTQLKLDQKVDDLLRDKLFSESKFAIWFHYAAEGEILPESATQIMLKHYSDEDLLKMFEAFAVKGKTRKAVWFPLIASWKDKNYTAIQVFKLMKLDQEMDNPPYDKLLRLWVDYVGLSSTTPLLAMKVVILGYFKNHETVEMISEGLERLGLAKKNVPKVPEVSEVPK